MSRITIQVLEGFERGRVYDSLETPVTIGREEDNSIQLNDERVSRFHVKIQEEAGRYILTDLDSTNGTKINGHPAQMRVLQPGDQLAIGRSILLFGSDSEIRDSLRSGQSGSRRHGPDEKYDALTHRTVSDFADLPEPEQISAEDARYATPSDDRGVLFPAGPPTLPAGLRISQSAQLSDLLAYVHDQLAAVCEAAREDADGERNEMRVERADWQRLLRLQMQLARYMREIVEP